MGFKKLGLSALLASTMALGAFAAPREGGPREPRRPRIHRSVRHSVKSSAVFVGGTFTLADGNNFLTSMNAAKGNQEVMNALISQYTQAYSDTRDNNYRALLRAMCDDVGRDYDSVKTLDDFIPDFARTLESSSAKDAEGYRSEDKAMLNKVVASWNKHAGSYLKHQHEANEAYFKNVRRAVERCKVQVAANTAIGSAQLSGLYATAFTATGRGTRGHRGKSSKLNYGALFAGIDLGSVANVLTINATDGLTESLAGFIQVASQNSLNDIGFAKGTEQMFKNIYREQESDYNRALRHEYDLATKEGNEELAKGIKDLMSSQHINKEVVAVQNSSLNAQADQITAAVNSNIKTWGEGGTAHVINEQNDAARKSSAISGLLQDVGTSFGIGAGKRKGRRPINTRSLIRQLKGRKR